MYSTDLAHKKFIESIFGSDDEENEETPCIPGLLVVRGFLNAEEQSQLLMELENEFGDMRKDKRRNQGMRFYGTGPAPEWFDKLSVQVQAVASCAWPELQLRRPLFNQTIANSYHPGQGIAAHVDLPAFADGIASISLLAPVIMDFERCCAEHDASGAPREVFGADSFGKVAVMLRPGDLLLMSGAARYEWRHGIAGRTADEWGNKSLPRGHRVSVTLRRMLHDVHALVEDDAECMEGGRSGGEGVEGKGVGRGGAAAG